MQYILHSFQNPNFLCMRIRLDAHMWNPFSGPGWWRFGSAGRSPGTFPPACCSPLLCWCTSRCRGQKLGCWRSAQWHVCRREIAPCRCLSWLSSDFLCHPLSEVWKHKCQEVWLDQLISQVNLSLNVQCIYQMIIISKWLGRSSHNQFSLVTVPALRNVTQKFTV